MVVLTPKTSCKATPALTTSAMSAAAGGAISDTATLTGGSNPTGSITFRAYSPNDPTCAASPASTSTKTVMANGPYTSDLLTVNQVGAYRWVAAYSGDFNNNATLNKCNDPNETSTVVKANPTLTTNASTTVVVGATVSDTANLAGGSGPTGSIVFNLYGPDDTDCTGTVKFSSTKTAAGNGSYPSDAFTTSAAGTYRWTASYAGDANNNVAVSGCNAANESVIVSRTTPVLITQASGSVPAGGMISDNATLSGGSGPAGTITFSLYGPNDTSCSGTVKFTSSKTVGGNGSYPSDPFTTIAAGTYQWIASYSGDANNNPVTGTCGDPSERTAVTIPGILYSSAPAATDDSSQCGTNIFFVKPDGTGVTQLTTGLAYDTTPTWSPDATRIAFSSTRGGSLHVFVMNADGTGITQLTTGMAYDTTPAWSPDGTRIAFSSSLAGYVHVFVMNADGTGVSQLTTGPAFDTTPTWSPDSTRIAFSSTRGGNLHIFVMDAGGSSITQLTTGSWVYDAEPAWSPDGGRIAFSSTRGGNLHVFVMNTGGSGITQLTTGWWVYDTTPAWSPDGARIAFSSTRSGSFHVFAINSDGSAITQITTGWTYDATPAW
jgi:hypothetical protein